MSRPVCERFCHGIRTDKTYKSFSFNNPSCITGTIKLSTSSAVTDKCLKTQWVIPRSPVLEQGVKERTTLVDSKFETLQRSVDNTTSVLCYNKNKCLLSMDPNRGKGNSQKYFGIEGSEVSLNVISQTNENESSSFSNRQTTALMYLLKMGGTGNKGLLDLAKDIWDYILRNGITITAEYLPS